MYEAEVTYETSIRCSELNGILPYYIACMTKAIFKLYNSLSVRMSWFKTPEPCSVTVTRSLIDMIISRFVCRNASTTSSNIIQSSEFPNVVILVEMS